MKDALIKIVSWPLVALLWVMGWLIVHAIAVFEWIVKGKWPRW